MFTWFERKALLDRELAVWQFDCFQWLLRHSGGVEELRKRPLVQPTPRFFPDQGLQGHAMAEAVFFRVRQHAGMANWPCELHPQVDDTPEVVPSAVPVTYHSSSAAGTFRQTESGAIITYHPGRLADPMSLVATFAHELAHYRTAKFPEPPPGGWDTWEQATDLVAACLGFGIFLANSRFHFSQFADIQVQGWQSRQQGYLSEPEILHAHAIRCHLLGTSPRETLTHLKPALRGIFRRVYRDVSRSVHDLGRLGRDAPLVQNSAIME